MNYRLYCLTNIYISSLQKGLQTAHVVSDLALAARGDSAADQVFSAWASQDRTIIILNGGNSLSLERWQQWLQQCGQRWPWAAFREDQQSLNGAITAVGMIVPESVYLNTSTHSEDQELYDKLQQHGLAV
jgi:hypothetical protein